MTTILALCGKKHVGKDTVANFIKEKYPDTVLLAIAGPLKHVCKTMFVLSNDQLHDQTLKEIIDDNWDVSPRELFQHVGDLFRDDLIKRLPRLKLKQSNIFITILDLHIKQILSSSNPPKFIIITDCRFEDEHKFMKSIGAKSIKLTRGNEIKPLDNILNIMEWFKSWFIKTHSSELIPFETDYTIHNNGELEDLQHVILHLCYSLKK